MDNPRVTVLQDIVSGGVTIRAGEIGEWFVAEEEVRFNLSSVEGVTAGTNGTDKVHYEDTILTDESTRDKLHVTVDAYTHHPDRRYRHSSVCHVLQYFHFEHLPLHLQEVSKRVTETAIWMADNLPENPELTVGLRKLLEAKDAFVRARLTK